MTSNPDIEAMGFFPNEERLQDHYDRRTALLALWSIVFAARGAIDVVVTRSSEGLTEDDRWSAGAIAEQLAERAAELEDKLDSILTEE